MMELGAVSEPFGRGVGESAQWRALPSTRDCPTTSSMLAGRMRTAKRARHIIRRVHRGKQIAQSCFPLYRNTPNNSNTRSMHAFAPTGRLASMADDTNYGSLGALAPNWDEGERNIDTDEIYRAFLHLGGGRQRRGTVATSGGGHHGSAGRRPCHFEHSDRFGQVAGGARHAFRRVVHGPPFLLHGSDQGSGV